MHSSNLQVYFNMHHPLQVDAALSMVNLFFVLFVMLFNGVALSRVVTELTVRPLERMLLTVRQIATTVFKFGSENDQGPSGESDNEDDNNTDIEHTSEMILLEIVVEKLANIAALQAKEEPIQSTEGMENEDIGVLSMMRGKNIMDAQTNKPKASIFPRRTSRIPMAPTPDPEDYGVSYELYLSWSFNTLVMSKLQRGQTAVFTIQGFHEPGHGYITSKAEKLTLDRFVKACEKEYKDENPFHNFAHAVDCLHTVARVMRLMSSGAFLTELEQFTLLVAALGHDLAHPGLNNFFLSEAGHELALKYNDRSPLENMHCAKLYAVLASEENNVLAKLSREQYREVRNACIEAVLHTDMIGHQGMVNDLQMTYQVNSEAFAVWVDDYKVDAANTLDEAEVFQAPETKILAMNAILHSADVSNPCRAWEVTKQWADCCLEEFFSQGDQEKKLGIPVQFLNDRDKLNRPNSQIGFLEFVISPLFGALIWLWPVMHEFGDNLARNMREWEQLWEVQEPKDTSEEEKQKQRARVDKVKDALEHAKARAPVV